MKDTPIYVRVMADDYDRLLNTLDALNYHWLSGQRAGEPPKFLKWLPEQTVGVRIVNPSKRAISFYPVEVLSEAERAQTMLRCKSVEQAVSILERVHHVSLAEELIPKRVGNRQSAAYHNFVTTLQALIYNEFHIDIVQLVNTEDENLIYIKQRAGENNVICKNMTQLYQQYLGNLMTMEQFAHSVGVHYEYALRDAKQVQGNQYDNSYDDSREAEELGLE